MKATLQIFDQLEVRTYNDPVALGQAAARMASQVVNLSIETYGQSSIILATGNSQLEFLQAFRVLPLQWSAVTVFHMDEYLGLAPGHPASFPRFLKKHFFNHVPEATFYPVPSRPDDVTLACQGYEQLLKSHRIDLCCLGIGENGHLAFNEPDDANFHDKDWVKVISLDETSRNQQVGEGHFRSLDEVPKHAITLTIPALLSAKTVLCMAPEKRKATAVRTALLGNISNACPASILRTSPQAHLFLDKDSASELPQ